MNNEIIASLDIKSKCTNKKMSKLLEKHIKDFFKFIPNQLIKL